MRKTDLSLEEKNEHNAHLRIQRPDSNKVREAEKKLYTF